MQRIGKLAALGKLAVPLVSAANRKLRNMEGVNMQRIGKLAILEKLAALGKLAVPLASAANCKLRNMDGVNMKRIGKLAVVLVSAALLLSSSKTRGILFLVAKLAGKRTTGKTIGWGLSRLFR